MHFFPKTCGKGTVKKKTPQPSGHGVSFVIPRGFEPRTHSLEGCCSIQLSYQTILRVQRYKKVLSYEVLIMNYFVILHADYGNH